MGHRGLSDWRPGGDDHAAARRDYRATVRRRSDGNLWWPAAGRQHEVPGLKPARISDTPGTSESSETVVRVHHAIERHAGNAVEIVGEGDRRCRDPDDGQPDESEAGDGNAAAAVAGDFPPRMVGLRMVPRNGLFQAASVAAC